MTNAQRKKQKNSQIKIKLYDLRRTHEELCYSNMNNKNMITCCMATGYRAKKNSSKNQDLSQGSWDLQIFSPITKYNRVWALNLLLNNTFSYSWEYFKNIKFLVNTEKLEWIGKLWELQSYLFIGLVYLLREKQFQHMWE
jgi:hypothetical protein